MTSFVTINHPTQHPGVVRAESALVAVRELGQSFSGTRGLATLLLSAIAAAIMVVAYQVMDSVAEGHLVVMWIAMWAVAFATLAVFAGAAFNLAANLRTGLNSWSIALSQARADQRLWALAKTDGRIMADLQCAMSRQETVADLAPATPVAAKADRKAERAVQFSSAVLRAYQRNYI